MRCKIAVIGAGSLAFTPDLVADLARSASLRGSSVILMDIDSEVLRKVRTIAERIVEAQRAELMVGATTDRQEALKDADFVTITIGVGGVKATQLDGKLAEKYGVYQTVADTVGPGGLSRALRHIPAIVDIYRDVDRLCPEALVINETNPLTVLCRVAREVTNVNVIGLCSCILGAHYRISKLLNVKDGDLTLLASGLNHFTWIKEALIKGEDAYPTLKKILVDLKVKADREGCLPPQPISLKLFEAFGLVPVPGDSHMAEFLPYFLRSEFDWGRKYGLEIFPGGTIYTDEWRENMWNKASDWAEGRNLNDLFTGRMGEFSFAPSIMEAIVKGETRFYEGVDVPNEGLVDGLPREAIVEGPGVAGPMDVRGVPVGSLPKAITAMLKARVEQQELTVEAALSGDRDLTLQALSLDPLTPNIDVAEKILDDILTLHANYLPQFRR